AGRAGGPSTAAIIGGGGGAGGGSPSATGRASALPGRTGIDHRGAIGEAARIGSAAAPTRLHSTRRIRRTGWRQSRTATAPSVRTIRPPTATSAGRVQAKAFQPISRALPGAAPGRLPPPGRGDDLLQLAQLPLAGVLRLQEAEDRLVERPVEHTLQQPRRHPI